MKAPTPLPQDSRATWTCRDKALLERLIPLLMSNGGDQDAAYRSVLGVTPEELTTALDSYAMEQLSAAGHELSRP